MITVSTLKSVERAYHHGDLRAALVVAGLRALETVDFSELSLRQLARDAGVSPTAVYRHFPDKQALLRALADEGIARLGRFQAAAIEAREPGIDPFTANGRAYVRFALSHPGLFRTVFVHADAVGGQIFGDNEAARLLTAQIQEFVPRDPVKAERLAIQAWATVHGLAMLMLEGHLPPDPALIDQVLCPGGLIGDQGNSSDESP
jgi:AcrR family transcriptional regulator